MANAMLAAILRGREDFRVRRPARPEPGLGKALALARTGRICGSGMP